MEIGADSLPACGSQHVAFQIDDCRGNSNGIAEIFQDLASTARNREDQPGKWLRFQLNLIYLVHPDFSRCLWFDLDSLVRFTQVSSR